MSRHAFLPDMVAIIGTVRCALSGLRWILEGRRADALFDRDEQMDLVFGEVDR
jgi:hypothetical protein